MMIVKFVILKPVKIGAMGLEILFITQVDLRPVEPPSTPIQSGTSSHEIQTGIDSSRTLRRLPSFQGDDYLNRLIDSLMELGFRPVRSNDEIVGSLQWTMDMSMKGYKVEEYRANNVREIVLSVDLETGREEPISTDPMDVHLYIVRNTEGQIVEAYLVRRIKHHYRTGEMRETLIIEKFIRNWQ